MKKLLPFIFIGIYIFGFSFGTQGESIQDKINDFSQIEKLVKKIEDPTATLIVMDDDDTLTMMKCDTGNPEKSCQYLGGPAWYSWQSTLLKNYLDNKDDSNYRVADNQQQLLVIATLLLAINNMDYTDTAIPTVLEDMTDKGVRLLVETARNNDDVSLTHSQLSNLKAGKNNFANLIEDNSLIFEQANSPSLASPFPPCNIPGYRDITYQQGVIYASGQNKGVLLKCVLNRYNSQAISQGLGLPIKYIIFIDDTLQNVIDMRNAFKDEKNYYAYALHYTALQNHKAALTQGKNKETLQKNANARWQAIKSALRNNLLQPNLGVK